MTLMSLKSIPIHREFHFLQSKIHTYLNAIYLNKLLIILKTICFSLIKFRTPVEIYNLYNSSTNNAAKIRRSSFKIAVDLFANTEETFYNKNSFCLDAFTQKSTNV